jgi:hypothetical protein
MDSTIVVAIIGGAATVAAALIGDRRGRKSAESDAKRLPNPVPVSTRANHNGVDLVHAVELRPCRWEINIASQVPLLTVIVWAINYTRETVSLGPSKIPYFRIDNVVVLNSIIDLDTVTLGAGSSVSLFIRYKLVDSEWRAIRVHATAELCSGEMTFSTHWQSSGRSGDFQSQAPYNVLGVIVGLPPRDTPQPFAAPT